jgi:hypothetical protein
MTTDPVTCFIGSSKEGLGYANALAAHLETHAITCEVWTDAFDLGKTTVEGLEDALARHSFAVLIATADDLTTSRRKAKMSPRDNVILEFGLFVGRLRRDRAFLLVEETDKPIKLPTDLLGVTLGFFPSRRTARAKKTSLAEPAAKVAAQIEKLGPLETPSDPAVANDVTMSASRLIDELRTIRKVTMSAAHRNSWTKRVLAAALEPFLARADDAYAAWLRPDATNVLKIVEAVNLQEDEWQQHEWKQGEGMAGKVWENARALAVDKRRRHPWFVARPGCANETYLCVPLGKPSVPEGLLVVGSDEGFDVRSGDLALLAVYAGLLGFAMPK